MNDFTKKTNRNTKYIKFIKNSSKASDYLKLQKETRAVLDMISRRKEEYQSYLSLKLSDPITNGKTYWSLSKTFYNEKKVPIILPLLTDKKVSSDFEVKANHFNNFFVFQ